MKYWCEANSNLAYFIELTTALDCRKQLLMSSISNLGGRESLEIAVKAQLLLSIILHQSARQFFSNVVRIHLSCENYREIC